jgi:hypothetical protein
MSKLFLGVLLLGTSLVLGACGFTPEGSLIRDTVKAKGAQAYDEGLENSEWFICNAASIGSVRRKYGTSAAKTAAYHELCSPTAVPDIISAPLLNTPTTPLTRRTQ